MGYTGLAKKRSNPAEMHECPVGVDIIAIRIFANLNDSGGGERLGWLNLRCN